MNWLAHLSLSEPDAECRLGSILADLVKGAARERLSPRIQRGIACHIEVDRFTDAHPLFLASQRRLAPEFAKFASVLIDVFYDHFLARRFDRYTGLRLREFSQAVYVDLRRVAEPLHEQAGWVVRTMATEDWLGSYARLDGISATLERMSWRLRRPQLLTPAVTELRRLDAELAADFDEFFPQLQARVNRWWAMQPDLESLAEV